MAEPTYGELIAAVADQCDHSGEYGPSEYEARLNILTVMLWLKDVMPTEEYPSANQVFDRLIPQFTPPKGLTGNSTLQMLEAMMPKDWRLWTSVSVADTM